MPSEISGSLRTARLLITFPTLCYGIIPLFADLNETHAFHPNQPAYARFHMVWLLSINSLVAVLALFLLWLAKFESALKIRLAGVLGICVFAGFFISTATASLYGGALSDQVGGVPPLLGIDANLFLFTPITALLVLGLWLSFRPITR